MSVEIPVPAPGDSEIVTNSLRNAALFGRIGQAQEALRWLQRAAESAAEADDDLRTLALARCVAELSGAIRAAAESSPATAPSMPPPASASATPSTAPEPSVHPSATPPPPPSSRSHASASPRKLEPIARAQPAASSPPAPQSKRQPPRESLPAAATVSPIRPKSVAPSVAPRLPRVAAPTAGGKLSSLRQAARVSITRSASEPGLFLVRLLEEGQVPERGAFEALIVSIDPDARPFTP